MTQAMNITRTVVLIGLGLYALFSAPVILAAQALHKDQTLVLTSSELDNGHQRLSEALAAAVPGYTSPLFANRGASAHARVVLDRGLSPDQTLILVNGERRYKSAIAHVTDTPAQGAFAVDLDAIPLAAIDRIEITRASGSVQHGSAGGAGVINVVLKNRDQGGELYADFSQHSTEVSGVDDVTATDVAPSVIGLTTAGDRNPDDGDGDTLRLGGSWGFKVGDVGRLNAAASFMDRKRTSREGFSRDALFPLTPEGEFDQRELTTERLLQRFGDADTQELNFSVAFEQQVHGLTFNLLASYAARTAKSFAAYQRPVSAPDSIGVFPEGFLPEQTSDSDGLSVTLQLAGTHFGWDWLATYHQGEDELDWTLQDSINLSLDLDPLNPVVAAPITEFLIGNNESRIQELSLKTNRYIKLPLADSNRLQLGFDYQLGDHEIERGDQASFLDGGRINSNGVSEQSGSQQVIGIRPDNEFDEGRVSYAVFAELQSAWDAHDLSSRIGARYNDYDDIGSEFDVSIGISWQPQDALRLNADISRGHRAPDIGQRFYNGTFVRYFDQALTRVEILGSETELAEGLGASELTAETSVSANLSAHWQLSDALRIRAAFAWLDLDDRVLLSETLASSEIDSAFQLAGIDAERAAFYVNGADTETTSLDIGTSYRLTLPGSYIDFDLDASLYNTNASSNSAAIERRVLQRLEEGGPGAKVHFRTNWQRPRTSLEFRATWFGDSTHPGDTAAADHDNGTGLLLDLTLEYVLNKTVTATIGGLNLFDAYPDEFSSDTTLSPNGFEIPFSSYTPWGFNGRSVFFALRATLP